MKFHPTPLAGAWELELEPFGDERGFFARAFCSNELGERDLATSFVQVNNSFSAMKGTLRGMHYQLAPAGEVKLVRCIRGALFDVVLDLREDSSTFGRSFGVELSAENRRMVYVPRGCAHGFLTLTDDSEVMYFVDQFYTPSLERGIRWNDPAFDIQWPFDPVVLSEKDERHPDFDRAYHLTA